MSVKIFDNHARFYQIQGIDDEDGSLALTVVGEMTISRTE